MKKTRRQDAHQRVGLRGGDTEENNKAHVHKNPELMLEARAAKPMRCSGY